MTEEQTLIGFQTSAHPLTTPHNTSVLESLVRSASRYVAWSIKHFCLLREYEALKPFWSIKAGFRAYDHATDYMFQAMMRS
jgi:hypothetical protein